MSSKNEKYLDSLRKVFSEGVDKITGQILWGILVNSNVYTPDGEEVGASFRGTGKIISELVGEGDYLDYYMSSGFTKEMLKTIGFNADAFENDLRQKLLDAGWKIEKIEV